MTDIALMKTTSYRPTGDTETWNIALGGNDYTPMTINDLTRMRDMINEVLNESQEKYER